MALLSSIRSIFRIKSVAGDGGRISSDRLIDWLTSPTGVSRIVNGVCLLLSAYLGVLTGEVLVKSELFKLPNIEIVSSSDVKDSSKKTKSIESYQIITKRNLFGSTAPAPVATQTSNSISKPKLRLVGTNVVKGKGSFAIIEDQNKNDQDIFSISDQVFTYGKLVEINKESVKIEYPDRTDILEIEEGRAAPGSSILGDDTQTIDDDQTEFTVSESELNEALGNLPLLLSQARAVPYFRNGQSIGMRLFAIRGGSLYEKLGLKNGDIITSVNNNSLSDPTQALRIFEQLKNERNIEVKMERNGLQRDSRYSIR